MFSITSLNLIRNKISLILLSIFLSITSGFTQIPSNIISQYSVNEGLAQSTVNCILRDKTGYLWVGTCGGLSRFDGYKFISFKNHPDLKNSISNNYVRWLHEDEEGNIWIGTEAGLDVWEAEKGAILNPLANHQNYGKTWFIPFYSKDGWLYFADILNGISKIELKSGTVTNLVPNTKFSCLTNICCSDEESSWLCAFGERVLIRYFPKDNRVEYYNLPDFVNNIIEIFKVSNNEILLATDEGLLLFNSQSGKYEKRSIGGSSQIQSIEGICKDREGNWWISLKGDGLIVCNNSFQIIRSYKNPRQNEQEIYPKLVSRMYSDREGNTWLGTDGSGLYSINPALSKFPVFRFATDQVDETNFIRCLTSAGNGKILVGTFDKGLFEVDTADDTFRKISLSGSGKSGSTTISAFADAGKNRVLVATNDCIAVYDTLKKVTLHVQKFVNNGLNTYSSFKTICALSDGRFLAGGNRFLYLLRLAESGNSLEMLDESLSFNTISLTNIGHDSIFAGSSDKGFQIFSVKENQIQQLKKPGLPEKYSGALFHNFCAGNQEIIWGATDLGLMKLTSGGEFIQLFTENEGLANNNIYGILKDKSGNLWFSSNKGVSIFNPSNESVTNFGVKDGLQSEEFNSGAFFQDGQGQMYFGGIDGFNYFYPEKIRFNQNLPNIVVTNFYILGEKETKNRNPADGVVKLNYFQNFFSVEVSALELSKPGLNEYSFFLNGQDITWSETGTNRFVRYNNLQPGKYELWAKATNNDKQWSSKVKLLVITITPPFWKTLWFRITAIVLFLLAFYYFMQWIFARRMKRKLEAIKRIQEIDVLRTKISRDLHDSAGATLTRISMMGELAKMDLNKKIDITNRLEAITESSRSLIDNFAEIIWATNPQHDNLESLMAYIRTFISEFTEELSLEVRFNVPENIPDIKIKPDTRHNIFLIVKEGVNNIVKHAQAGTVLIEMKMDASGLVFTISDDGIGMQTGCKRLFGNGLNSMQERASAIGANCRITSSAGKGTTIKLVTPLN